MKVSYTSIILSNLLLILHLNLILANPFPVIGVALIQPAPGGSQVYGQIQITQQYAGSPLVVEGIVFNLKQSTRHGLHVHETGDLSKGCLSLGGHFNPHGKLHGSEKSITRHTGDFGNIITDAFGVARIYIVIQDGALFGEDGWIGRSLVVSEFQDDLGLANNEESRKTGNSGGRLACGVIGIKYPLTSLPTERTMHDRRYQ
ncbi:unnamed protein product [Didymodactylos carnosus]|uniref:Superoxide dismutase [Cu-Zn] n=1 Tax=Didymodactylos carnosus TaxID=1234261 RepID=A0A813T2X3_9BILA|nr:unnamed protein product [Didymodactylos carnosus]CAF0802701.1 unnamed protein product [Didymodactylos carnosus]CAF3541844.1 unnamed protein product [Didymodactylos carnosus]CAF3587879.1 unnamed protein product [Didymodactylos carnosus]